MVHEHDTSAVPVTKPVSSSRLCLKERQGGSLFLLHCPGSLPRFGTVSLLPLCPSPTRPRTARSTSPTRRRRNAGRAKYSLVKPCPGSLFLVVHGVEATAQSCRIRDSRPHPLQPFNDPQPSAPPVNCPHFPNRPGGLGFLLFITACSRTEFSSFPVS